MHRDVRRCVMRWRCPGWLHFGAVATSPTAAATGMADHHAAKDASHRHVTHVLGRQLPPTTAAAMHERCPPLPTSRPGRKCVLLVGGAFCLVQDHDTALASAALHHRVAHQALLT